MIYQELIDLKKKYSKFLSKKASSYLTSHDKNLLAELSLITGAGNFLLGELNFQISLDMTYYQACGLYFSKNEMICGATKIYPQMTLTNESEKAVNKFKVWLSEIETKFKIE